MRNDSTVRKFGQKEDASVSENFRQFFLRFSSFFEAQKPNKKRKAVDDVMVFGFISQDSYQKILAILRFSFELFKVVMATLLAIFVPQQCPADPPEHPEPHSCTEEENVTNLTTFNKAVLGWNFITLGFALIHYWLVYKRENSLIEYLDEEPALPDTNLPKMLPGYPEIDAALMRWNFIVLCSSLLTIVIFIINSVLSAVLVFRDYYDGFRSVTVFLTNIALMGTILERTLWHSYAGIQKRIALSCIDFRAADFNSIDRSYINDPMSRQSSRARPSGEMDRAASVEMNRAASIEMNRMASVPESPQENPQPDDFHKRNQSDRAQPAEVMPPAVLDP